MVKTYEGVEYPLMKIDILINFKLWKLLYLYFAFYDILISIQIIIIVL